MSQNQPAPLAVPPFVRLTAPEPAVAGTDEQFLFARPKTLLQDLEEHECWQNPRADPVRTAECAKVEGDTYAARREECIRMATRAARTGATLTGPAMFPIQTLGHDQYISLSDIAHVTRLKQALDLPDRLPQSTVSQTPQAPVVPIRGIDFAPPPPRAPLPPFVQDVVNYIMDQWRRKRDRLPKRMAIKRHFEGWDGWPAGETQFTVNGHFRLRRATSDEVLISDFSAWDLGLPQDLYYYFTRPT